MSIPPAPAPSHSSTRGKSLPLLVLAERSDGTVVGARVTLNALGRVCAIEGAIAAIASEYVEPGDVQNALDDPSSIDWPAGLEFGYVIGPLPTDGLWTRVSSSEQQPVMIYRVDEWFMGLLNPGTADPHLGPASDLGVPPSKAALARRGSIDTLSSRIARKLPLAQLKSSVDMANVRYQTIAEKQIGVRWLVEWWNKDAPESLRAGLFRVYQWDPARRQFIDGDWESPPADADAFDKHTTSVALCDDPSLTGPIVLVFLRGAPYREERSFTQILYADGSVFSEVGLGADEVDEARYSVRGLQSLRDTGCNLQEMAPEHDR